MKTCFRIWLTVTDWSNRKRTETYILSWLKDTIYGKDTWENLCIDKLFQPYWKVFKGGESQIGDWKWSQPSQIKPSVARFKTGSLWSGRHSITN